ncbi:MAG: DUF402 domain-containing protein [Lachnospiraceae bacterium]|jgi:hypothetical protein|nr:DUF402 domain-containing protein [Lachnospiraceae bacterium]MBQ5559314.1 DUF402 domain-containing protein [Lachnospiraceae bacterium]MCR4801629.1 DUF402 domain-containing protein [Lachnospiraceae bacterium]
MTGKGPFLYRKRLIPDEMIPLVDDTILHCDSSVIITKWNSLKPRKDISCGISGYFIEEGFKISKVFDKHHKLVYWYCDIIETEVQSHKNAYVFLDLLADVLVYPDGQIHVVDLDEVADALETKLITKERGCKALKLTNNLLNIIYSGKFKKYQNIINKYENM